MFLTSRLGWCWIVSTTSIAWPKQNRRRRWELRWRCWIVKLRQKKCRWCRLSQMLLFAGFSAFHPSSGFQFQILKIFRILSLLYFLKIWILNFPGFFALILLDDLNFQFSRIFLLPSFLMISIEKIQFSRIFLLPFLRTSNSTRCSISMIRSAQTPIDRSGFIWFLSDNHHHHHHLHDDDLSSKGFHRRTLVKDWRRGWVH